MIEEKKNSILIVDDEMTELKILTHILSNDYTIYTAINGIDAIEIAKENMPDLILLDIIMPVMDGYQTFDEIKKCKEIHKIPVVFITSLNSVEDEEKGLDLNAVDYIHKPFSKKIVELRVRKIIQTINQIRKLTEHHPNAEHTAEAVKHNKMANAEEQSNYEHPVKSKKPQDGVVYNSFMENISRIGEINAEIGLTRSSGKEYLYQKILGIFQKKIAPECVNMTAFLEAGDIKNFTISVHAMKTLLATVGAMKLSSAAYELEMASKDEDIDDCTQRFFRFKKALLSLDKKLSAVFSEI